MKFQPGDKVLILHSNEEGEVVDIINDKMVMVSVRGVNFPAYVDQLDFPYFRRFTEKKPAAPQPGGQKKYIDQVVREQSKSAAARRADNGIWLTFVPVVDADEFGDEVVEELKIHLVNQTGQAYRFEYTLEYFGEAAFELKNQVNAYQDFYIHDMPFENLNDSPSFNLVFSLVQADKKKADSYETSFRLKPKQVFARIQEIRAKGDATFSYQVLDRYPDRLPEDKPDLSALTNAGYKVYPAASARQHLEPAKYELDLHIEKLMKDHRGLSNFEILSLQLQTLEKYLDLAVAHRQHSMIVIHGLGTGKLRDEVHEVLRLRSEVKSFYNRYHPAYGYGATEINFQY